MRKIKVTKANLGTVISVVQKLMEKPFSLESKWDVKKLCESTFEDSTNHMDLYRKAIVKKHWLAEDKTERTNTPLVHIDFLDKLNFLVIYEGDTLVLLGGSKFLLQQKETGLISVLNKESLTYLIKRIDFKSNEDEILTQECTRLDEYMFYESMNEEYEEEMLNSGLGIR